MFMSPPIQTCELTAEGLRSAAHARRTLLSYGSDWKLFAGWCETARLVALPASADTVALYLTHVLNSGRKISTALRHLASIRFAHREARLASPCGHDAYELLRGAQHLRHEHPNQKAPLSIDQLSLMCAKLGSGAMAARDRAMLLLGFASALRRSTLVELDLADLSFEERGVIVRVRFEKQDQDGVGRTIAVPRGHAGTCAVLALGEWLRYRGRRAGPLFTGFPGGRQSGIGLRPCAVGRVVKRAVESIGLDARRYAAHSLRAGFVTEALVHGVNEVVIAAHTGHRSLNTLRLYFRPRDAFQANACSSMGL